MRLQKGHEFRYVKDNSKQLLGKYLVLSYVKSTNQQNRIGIITSKKYDTKAVERNRARRIIREAYREISRQINKPTWIVFIARDFLHNKKKDEVKKEMSKLLQKANLV